MTAGTAHIIIGKRPGSEQVASSPRTVYLTNGKPWNIVDESTVTNVYTKCNTTRLLTDAHLQSDFTTM